jgi:hypothetical protein
MEPLVSNVKSGDKIKVPVTSKAKTTKALRLGVRKLAVALHKLEQQAMDLGLFETSRYVNSATVKLGWEAASESDKCRIKLEGPP